MNSIALDLADCEIDLPRTDGLLDEAINGCMPLAVSAFSDRKTWSSLAAVLFLHAALTCILWVSSKPHPDSRKWIEVQLVSLQGSSDSTASEMQGGLEAGGKEQSAAVAAPANPEMPNAHLAAEHNTKPPPIPPISNSRPAVHPKKMQRAALHPDEHEEIQREQPLPPAQTGAGANESEGSNQTAGPGAAPAGASNQGGAGGNNASGGSGLSEKSFGSPDGPNFLHKVLPAYPALARRLEKEGTVLLRVTIDERGRPIEVEVLRKAGFGFDEEAVRAVQSSTFVPAKKEGKALSCKALLPIRFVLKNS